MKININDLEKMDKYDPNYNKNPLLQAGLEDMNSPVKDTIAAIALNQFGFAMDQLAENNYPYSNPQVAVEAILNRAFDDFSITNFMEGIETEKPGVIARVWSSIKSFFKRIFDFIFGKGTSDRTSIRYYARLLKEKVAAMLGKGAQTPEEAKDTAERRAALFIKTKEIMDREKNTMDAKEGKVAGAIESEGQITSPVEAMELLNKITPQIHLVGQLIADAMSKSYTEASLNEKIVPRLNQIEKSYKEYEAVLKSISMSSISLEGLSQSDLAKLYNQTTKFEMLWKQFESTRKLVDSINIEDMQRRMFSNDCINTLMSVLRKVQSGVLTIRSVVRALIGKISSGNETQDYYDDIFDYAYSEGNEGDFIKNALVFAGAGAIAYAVWKIFDKLWDWLFKKGTSSLDQAVKDMKASRKQLEDTSKQLRESLKNHPLEKINAKSQNIKLIDYAALNNRKLRDFEGSLRGILSIMQNIQDGNFNSYLGKMSQTNNITRLTQLADKMCSYTYEIDPMDLIGNQSKLNQIMESLTIACEDFKHCSDVIKSFEKYKGMKVPEDKFNKLTPQQQESIKKYLENVPNEISTILNCYNKVKNAIIASNNQLRDCMVGFLSATYRTGLNGSKQATGFVRDIIDNTSLESEEYIELKNLLEQYQLACESEEFFGLESGNDKPGLIKRIWNAIIKFFKKIWSKLTRQGYRGKEAVLWDNTQINSGYEDEIVNGIPLKYAEDYVQYVAKLKSLSGAATRNTINAFKHAESSKSKESIENIIHCLQQEINACEKCLQFATPNIPQADITAKELLASMTKITNSYNEYLAAIKSIPATELSFDPSDYPEVDQKLLTKVIHLMDVLDKTTDRMLIYERAIKSTVASYNLSVKANEARFTKIFGPKDRSKAQLRYKELNTTEGSESEQLNYLLSL